MQTNQLVNVSTLVRLADTGVESQMVALGAMSISDDIKESLTRQASELKKEVVDAAAKEILNLVQNAETFLARQVASKNALLEQIAGIDKTTAAVNKARLFGFATDNFLPLASAIGMGIPSGTKEVLKNIPKDWTAPTAPAAE